MREIKFRAWITDGDLFEMDKEVPYMEHNFAFEEYMMVNDELKQMQVNGFPLMQYTGLKDKNGKEIYEGDIIRRDFEIGHVVYDPVTLGAEDYVIDDSGYFIGVVHFRPSEGYVLNKCTKYDIDGEVVNKKSGVKIYSEYAEVIGNIYEDGDLL